MKKKTRRARGRPRKAPSKAVDQKCTKCLETKPIDAFYFQAARSRYDSWCKQCKIDTAKASYHDKDKKQTTEPRKRPQRRVKDLEQRVVKYELGPDREAIKDRIEDRAHDRKSVD